MQISFSGSRDIMRRRLAQMTVRRLRVMAASYNIRQFRGRSLQRKTKSELVSDIVSSGRFVMSGPLADDAQGIVPAGNVTGGIGQRLFTRDALEILSRERLKFLSCRHGLRQRDIHRKPKQRDVLIAELLQVRTMRTFLCAFQRVSE